MVESPRCQPTKPVNVVARGDHARCSRIAQYKSSTHSMTMPHAYAQGKTATRSPTRTWLLHCVAGEHGGGDYKLVLPTSPRTQLQENAFVFKQDRQNAQDAG